jgi:hypothetical protein
VEESECEQLKWNQHLSFQLIFHFLSSLVKKGSLKFEPALVAGMKSAEAGISLAHLGVKVSLQDPILPTTSIYNASVLIFLQPHG